jgi:glycerophosphoryl diester phosphodiesterase
MKRKIIGHRGAAGLELENTATSLRRALSLHVSGVEIDVRLTKDAKLVVCHDSDLGRVARDSRQIKDLTVKQLKKIPLTDGSEILTLPDALKIIGDVPVIIELKDHGTARAVLDTLKKFPDAKASIASFKIEELVLARNLAPEAFLYALEQTKPFEIIHMARILKLNGIGLNYWLLNPLTYFHAHRSGLAIYVYTVNNKFRAKFLSWLYPNVAICTDHPEWFVRKRRKALKKAVAKKKKINASHL